MARAKKVQVRLGASIASSKSQSRFTIQVGHGDTIGDVATENGLAQASKFTGMEIPEVMNRATITGAIEIGRHPGVVQVTFRAPVSRLSAAGIMPLVRDQYGTEM